MDLLWMILLVVQVCAEVQNVKEVKGDLDGDVTLTCSIRNKDVHWFMEIHNQLRVLIGRTYSSAPKYSSADFETKYLMQENRLVIKNLTAEDSRTYFCGEKINNDLTVVDTFHLISDVPIAPPVTADPSHYQSDTRNIRIWQLAAVSSFCLNVVLIFAVTGLTCTYFRKKMNNPPHFSHQTPETLEGAQSENIQLSPPGPFSCVYYKAQHLC